MDQAYSEIQTQQKIIQVNTNQHESTPVNLNQHESDTNHHEPT